MGCGRGALESQWKEACVPLELTAPRWPAIWNQQPWGCLLWGPDVDAQQQPRGQAGRGLGWGGGELIPQGVSSGRWVWKKREKGKGGECAGWWGGGGLEGGGDWRQSQQPRGGQQLARAAPGCVGWPEAHGRQPMAPARWEGGVMCVGGRGKGSRGGRGAGGGGGGQPAAKPASTGHSMWWRHGSGQGVCLVCTANGCEALQIFQPLNLRKLRMVAIGRDRLRTGRGREII